MKGEATAQRRKPSWLHGPFLYCSADRHLRFRSKVPVIFLSLQGKYKLPLRVLLFRGKKTHAISTKEFNDLIAMVPCVNSVSFRSSRHHSQIKKSTKKTGGFFPVAALAGIYTAIIHVGMGAFLGFLRNCQIEAQIIFSNGLNVDF